MPHEAQIVTRFWQDLADRSELVLAGLDKPRLSALGRPLTFSTLCRFYTLLGGNVRPFRRRRLPQHHPPVPSATPAHRIDGGLVWLLVPGSALVVARLSTAAYRARTPRP